MNRKVDIQEDVKRYQETLSYASSKVDYSVGENLFMLPSNMELRIRSGTVGYNKKILVSDSLLTGPGWDGRGKERGGPVCTPQILLFRPFLRFL